MSKTARTLTALVIAVLSLPAAAGSWPNVRASKAPAKAAQSSPANDRLGAHAARKPTGSTPAVAVTSPNPGGFEYLGGDAGWQPVSHTLVWKAGRFVHSDECDHVIRMVKAPTPDEIDAFRRNYSGG